MWKNLTGINWRYRISRRSLAYSGMDKFASTSDIILQQSVSCIKHPWLSTLQPLPVAHSGTLASWWHHTSAEMEMEMEIAVRYISCNWESKNLVWRDAFRFQKFEEIVNKVGGGP